MNEQKLHSPRCKRVAMVRTWQIVLFGACSMVLSTGNVLCDDQYGGDKFRQSNHLVSYANPYSRHPQYNQQHLQSASIQVQSTANQAIGRDSNGAPEMDTAASISHQQQPSVYLSTNNASNARSILLSPAVQASTSTGGDLNTAAGSHHGHAYGKYYEYRAVPKKKTWKYGYKRGNHKHTISRHEHGKAGKHPHFKTKVKWHDAKSKGKGIHLWDYNHHDKKHYHHG